MQLARFSVVHTVGATEAMMVTMEVVAAARWWYRQ